MVATCLGCENEFEPHSDSRGKYCSNKCQQNHLYCEWEAEVVRTGQFNPVKCVKTRHRRYLFERQGGKCAVCGRKTWLSKPIPLAFDHINGHSDDWRVCNCRLICNNCDA